VPSSSTRERILAAARLAIAERGYDGVSLDQLAAGLGVTKQTVLHHVGSKDGLITAVLVRCADELGAAFDHGLATAGSDWDKVDAVVRSVFRLAFRRPELIGFVREVGRPGSPHGARLLEALEPLTARASAFLASAARRGTLAPTDDPRRLVQLAYAQVIGAATELEVLRTLGVRPHPRQLLRRRNAVLADLRLALVEPIGASRAAS
jgi:AcrR family transcriptional regulator